MNVRDNGVAETQDVTAWKLLFNKARKETKRILPSPDYLL